MKVLIIEDEVLAADNLAFLLKQINPEIEILSKIESVRKAVTWLKNNTCNLIFMDIQLSDGDSFTIFQEIEVKTPIIFTTAYDQYAIKAFKHNSVDYLLKPINKDELKQSLEKFQTYHNQNFDIQSIIKSFSKKINYQERFLVSAGMKLRTIKTTDVSYFYVQEKGVYLCTFENKNYDINYTLDKLQEILDPGLFFRINRQYIVNIEAIENMITVSKSRLLLEIKPKPANEVIVSFNNVHDFKLWLNK